MNIAYLLTGGNLGDRASNLGMALDLVSQRAGKPFSVSSLHETAAWGVDDQPDYLNQAIGIETELPATDLLQILLEIELEMGRVRARKYGPRVLDIDILFFNNDVIDLPSLSVPHPQIQNRRFVLVPMAEIAPELLHPTLHKTIASLLESCPDQLDVKKFYEAKAANQVDL